MKLSVFLVASVILAGLFATSAGAVPIVDLKLARNDDYAIQVNGFIYSPPSASDCEAVVRSTLQVPASGGWRTIRSIGSFRVDVCRHRDGRWSYGGFYSRYPSVANLKAQTARACVSATQVVNGYSSKHIKCKRFVIHVTVPASGSPGTGL